MDQSYEHLPLPDARTHIRLLNIINRDLIESNVQCNVETWPLSEAPPYSAVSYVWGSPAPRCHIQINGNAYEIGQNAHHALRQASKHTNILWMDSICINQEDTDEKALQVSIMGDIYESAQEIFACVGQHGDDSEFLLRVFGQLDTFYFPIQHMEEGYKKDRLRERLGDILKSESDSHEDETALARAYERFGCAWLAFGQREYWSRVWIIQELWLASEATVLCGPDAIPLASFARPRGDVDWSNVISKSLNGFSTDANRPGWKWSPTHMRSSTYMSTLLQWIPRLQEEPQETDRLEISDMFATFGSWRCKDFRDHMYGLLRITDWPGNPPRPDYRITKHELMIQFLSSLIESSALEDLLVCYSMSWLANSIGFRLYDDEGMALIARRRFQPSHQLHKSNRDPAVDVSHLLRLPSQIYLIESDENGTLSTNLSPTYVETLPDRPDIPERDVANCKRVMMNGRIIAYACPSIQAGDYLVKLWYGASPHSIWAVGRCKVDSKLLELLGYAVIQDRVFPPLNATLEQQESHVHVARRGNVELLLDPEDLLVFTLLGEDRDRERLLKTAMKINMTKERWSSFGRVIRLRT